MNEKDTCQFCFRPLKKIELFTSVVYECVDCPGPEQDLYDGMDFMDWSETPTYPVVEGDTLYFNMCYRCRDAGCSECPPNDGDML